MKITIITCVLNNERFIDEAIKSFQKQSYENKEHVIIDGGSTDKNVSIIKQLKNNSTIFISSNDNVIYDAIHKGVNLDSGTII